MRFMGISLASLLPLAACSPTGLVNALTPSSTYSLESAVPYGADPRQKIDIYRASERRDGAPLVVFFYGGGWESGKREDYRFIGEAFAAQGYDVAIPDYRLYPQVRWRGFMADAADSVAKLIDGGPGDGEADSGIVVAGHSAGAYIAAMLALDRSWLGERGVEECSLRAFIGLAGPYDFLPLREQNLKSIFGPGEAGPQTQPVHHAGPWSPPAFLATGLEDTTVLPRNSIELARRLSRNGVDVTKHAYDGVGHTAIIGGMSRPGRFLAPTHRDVFDFLAELETAGESGRCSGPVAFRW